MRTLMKSILLVTFIFTCACSESEEDRSEENTPMSASQPSSSGNLCENPLADLGTCLAIFWLGTFFGLGTESGAETTEAAPLFAGSAFVSPADATCCPADPGVTVAWTNGATGGSGTADSSVSDAGESNPRQWAHNWEARIPLRSGINPITITAYDRSGNWATKTVTVNRSE